MRFFACLEPWRSCSSITSKAHRSRRFSGIHVRNRGNPMNYTILAASIIVVAAAWHVTATIMIYEALRKRSIKVSFILLRLLAPKLCLAIPRDYQEGDRQDRPALLSLDRLDQHGAGRGHSARAGPDRSRTLLKALESSMRARFEGSGIFSDFCVRPGVFRAWMLQHEFRPCLCFSGRKPGGASP